MKYTAAQHTFAVCAYKESPYLEACVRSLMKQKVKGEVIICTSTPNAHIEAVAKRYDLPLFINSVSEGIASDWNFAMAQSKTPLVTLAHQDDIYDRGYLRAILRGINQGGKALIAFTDYYEIQDGKKIYADTFINLRIKQLMLAPLKIPAFQSSKFIRRRILSVGDPIGCPAVTYVKKNLPDPVFEVKYNATLDWQTWEAFSRMEGRFCYVPKALMGHRMYAGSTTVEMIKDNGARSREDLEILKLFWPEPVAKLIGHFYAKSQKKRMELK